MKEDRQEIDWSKVGVTNALEFLAPDLWAEYQKEKSELHALHQENPPDDDPRWAEEMLEQRLDDLYAFAFNMVRYASSNNPTDSWAQNNPGSPDNTYLINPLTGKPFTLDDVLGVEKIFAQGSTAGIAGRERVAFEIAIRMYRYYPLGTELKVESA